jgi:hypothetical protein
MRDVRLGDDVDDYCVRCKRITNHAVVSVINAEPAKVRCRTCHSDHDFRHEQAPPPKIDLRKQALFTEVLKKVDPGASTEAAAGAEPALELEELEIGAEAGDGLDVEAESEELPAVEESEPEAEAVKPKAKPKGRARK